MTAVLRAALLIVSDTVSQGVSTDKCEPVLKHVFATASTSTSAWEVAETTVVADDVQAIQRAICQWTDGDNAINLVVTSGGTGFATRDVTPEAVTPLIHKHAPGLVHGMLSSSLSITPFAIMARPVAGVRNGTIILTLPGSPKGAKENLESVIKLLAHACEQTAGANSRLLHSGGVQKLERDAGVSGSKPAGTSQHSHSHQHHQHHGHGHGHGHAGPRPHTRPEDRPKPNDPSQGAVGRHRESPYPMISVQQALDLIAENVPAPTIETAALSTAVIGSVIAEDVQAVESVPAYRASIVDGYAVVIGDGQAETKGVYPVSIISHAKPSELETLKSGQVARITTGAPLPPGADAVVMVEDTVLKSTTDDGKEEREIEILASGVRSGENVREIGSDVAAGDVVLRKGEGISAIGGEFGLLASVGIKEVKIYKRPKVAVLSTGDEIVNHDHPTALQLGEVRDTNRPTLLQSIKNTGFEGVDLGIASDGTGALEARLRDAMRAADVVITSGGVSMGELDLLKPTIETQLGGTIHFGRVSMKPGKPTTFATVPFTEEDGSRSTRMIFSLPGNPASAVVTYHLFVLPALHRFAGIKPEGLPPVRVTVAERTKCDAVRQEYVRAQVVGAETGLVATSTGGQRSSRIGSFKGANALLVMPTGQEWVEKGDAVTALVMGPVVGQV